MPPELANMAQMMLGQLGVDPGGQQQLMQHFGGIMQALRQSSGTYVCGRVVRAWASSQGQKAGWQAGSWRAGWLAGWLLLAGICRESAMDDA
jgi:hypothetical protein